MRDDLQDKDNRLAEAMHQPPRIRAACLWGDNLEHRIDFDAAYWFQYWSEEDILWHFYKTIYVNGKDGILEIPLEGRHPEWGRIELMTEIADEHPEFAPMLEWLSHKRLIGSGPIRGIPDTVVISFITKIYVSRSDALEWLRIHRPGTYADLKYTYTLPPPEARFFP